MTVSRSRVDQLVFRWDADNRSGSTGFGLVAWSCEPDQAEAVCRGMATKLQVAGDEVTPGLVRIGVKGREEVLLVRRVPGHDPGGRPGTVCHALLGSSRDLDVETCLGLHPWTWEGSALPLNEVRGKLEPVPADVLLRAAAPRGESLSRALGRFGKPLSVAAAEILRHPGHRYSFLDRWGGDVPYLLLWGLYGIFRDLRAQHPLGWSFATHDSDDSEPFRFVFLPSWPASASHDVRRVRTDLRQPIDDDAMDIGTWLVRFHLEWLRHTDGREPAVSAVLAEAGEHLERWEQGDGLLRAAQHAVKELNSAVWPVNRAMSAPERAGYSTPSRDEHSAPGHGGNSPQTQEGNSTPEQEGDSAPEQEADEGMMRARSDERLLRDLRDDLPYDTVALVLQEIARRFIGWPRALRENLCGTALDESLFLDIRRHPWKTPGREDAAQLDCRIENAIWLYRQVIRPLAKDGQVSGRLQCLLPDLHGSEDAACRTAVRVILEEGELPGLDEEVWRAVVRAECERAAVRRTRPRSEPPQEEPAPHSRPAVSGGERTPTKRGGQPIGIPLSLAGAILCLVALIIFLAVS
ncbi:hypothetical protein [Streptomyces sp. ODS28]|uniref:hypothetical protein n=1 Tax=Streptomyces sp. ODS28 TaxID=3136688 RepID=UPI0031F0BBFC